MAFRSALVWLGLWAACGGSSSNAPDAGTAIDGAQSDAALADAGDGSACTPGSASGSGQVVTTTGVVQGSADAGTFEYLGIPYAAPPTGSLRFAPPAAPSCWNGTRDATAFGAICPQMSDQNTVEGDEDCLFVNVWTPASATPASKLPVMVFIHGGGHQQGASSITDDGIVVYDGKPLSAGKDVIVVTLNYRLGPLGFLANSALASGDPHGSTGDYGTLDQIAALQWVQANIGAFGGDPSRVLLFGESAGGEAVCALMSSPLASGLFASALSESGPCDATPLARAETYGDTVVSAVGCGSGSGSGSGSDSDSDIAACLRSQSVAALIQTEPAAVIGALPYNAVVDGYVLPLAPTAQIAAGAHNQVPIILGTNLDEMGAMVPAIANEQAFDEEVTSLADSLGMPNLAQAIETEYPVGDYASPRDAYVAVLTDAYFACPAREASRLLAAHQSAPVYRYLFTHLPDHATAAQQAEGVVHASELPFVFGSLPNPGAGDAAVIATFAAYWSNMAIDQDPNASGLVTWPTIVATGSATSDTVLQIDSTVTTVADYRTSQCDFWAAQGF